MSYVTIIGFGSSLRGGDCVGLQAVELIAADWRDPMIKVLAVHQLTPELAEVISQTRPAIFVDASIEDGPGIIRHRRIVADSSQPFPNPHQLTPAGPMAWAETLYGKSPQAVLVSIGAQRFEFGEYLSAAIRHSLPDLIGRIDQLIKQHLPEAY